MWQPPADDGGAAVTHYIVEKRETSRVVWSVVSEKLEECIVTTTKVIKGNEYIFRVRGVNKFGVGDPLESDTVIAKNAFVTPGQPGIPEASMITKHSMTIVWSRPTVDGGSEINGYYLEKRDKKSLSWFKVSKETIRDTRQKVTGLTENSEYQFRVSAVNAAGQGPFSDASDFYKAEDPIVLDTPSACQRLHLKHVSRGTVTLVWDPPLINGGSEVTNYVIDKRDATKRAWSSVTAKCSNTSFKITDLSEKIPYFFRVLAENENGLGEPCETSEPVKAAEVPGPVRDLAMKDSTKTSDEHEWSYAGASKACEFEVEKLKELSVMEFRVSAKNEKGRSDFSVIGPITVKDYVITPEADLSDIPGGQVTVRIGYNVHVEIPYKGKPKPTMSWLKDNIPLKESEQVRFKKTENKITLSVKNVKKENGGKYTLILDNGVHRKSFPITVITLGPPSKPKGPIKLDEIRADSMVLSWGVPEDDGGGEITGYSVEKRETSQTNWKMICSSVEHYFTSFYSLVAPNIEFGAEHFEGLTVKAGESIRFKVFITGRPVPQVMWYKDGAEIDKRLNMEINNAIGYSTLFVRDASREHRGVYRIEAKNASGTRQADITIRVHGNFPYMKLISAVNGAGKGE
uniref:Titin n=1 Tax=Podarcis muralis TaxID=64176 RepID=A0A670HZ63_PODMU